MKASLNWLKEYLQLDQNPEKIGEILTEIGLEVEGIETVEEIKGGLEGVVIGEVMSCEKHPDADRLSITTVNLGTGEPVQIVCGAPNVAAGQKVPVATVGTTLYDKEGASFKIKKGKIRGQVSQGMICAEDELGLGNSHEGIMVLNDDAIPGTPAREYFNIKNDIVYEIGLTPNRSDATAHLGIAKDLLAALKINYNYTDSLKLPQLADLKAEKEQLPIQVKVENHDACPRYSGIVIDRVKIAPSPDWMQKRLNAIGVRPINNVVDITNYVLHEYGQPLHAFDYDKIAEHTVLVKTLPEDTLFESLDEVDRKLSAEDLMICDGKSQGMCMAGVFGGINSGVTDHTTRIFLESAHFHPRWIRRTSTRHLLRTDAASVFEKGSDPNITTEALRRAIQLLQEYAGAHVASTLIDIYPHPIRPKEIDLSYKNVNRIIGIDIPKEKVKKILRALEIEIKQEAEERLTVAVPTNKADVLREIDVIEEILRIYGFNNVPIPTQIKSKMGEGHRLPKHKVRDTLGNFLYGQGFNEIMGISLTQSSYFEELLPVPENKMVFVNNTSNVHLDVMRPYMLTSGLEAIVRNQNRKNADLKLFESGFTYHKEGENFQEEEHLTLFLTGQRRGESWQNESKPSVTYYTLKGYVDNILKRVGVGNYQTSVLKTGEQEEQVFSYGLKYHRGPQIVVEFGKVNARITEEMGIKQEVFYADFRTKTLLNIVKKAKIDFQELNKYPSVRRDLALVIGKNVKFDEIAGIARKIGKKILKEINLFSVYENEEQLGKDKKSYALSFIFENPAKTLKDKEVDKVMQQLIHTYEKELEAVIRR